VHGHKGRLFAFVVFLGDPKASATAGISGITSCYRDGSAAEPCNTAWDSICVGEVGTMGSL